MDLEPPQALTHVVDHVNIPHVDRDNILPLASCPSCAYSAARPPVLEPCTRAAPVLQTRMPVRLSLLPPRRRILHHRMDAAALAASVARVSSTPCATAGECHGCEVRLPGIRAICAWLISLGMAAIGGRTGAQACSGVLSVGCCGAAASRSASLWRDSCFEP